MNEVGVHLRQLWALWLQTDLARSPGLCWLHRTKVRGSEQCRARGCPEEGHFAEEETAYEKAMRLKDSRRKQKGGGAVKVAL